MIYWKGLPSFEEMWEDNSVINEQFAQFNLKEKVDLWATGNVKALILMTCLRKMKGKPTGTYT